MEEPQPQPVGATGAPDEATDPGRVEELLRTLASTVRSYRLYSGDGPILERFVETLREKLHGMWDGFDRVRLEIGERAMTWEGHRVFPTGDASGDLAFLFYKDGIRSITLLPGLENELSGLLSVLGRAPQLREEEDDLVTLLWQENLTGLAYECVDMPVEASDIGAPSSSPPARIDPAAVREAAKEEPAPAAGLVTDDFQETLYFLDDTELRQMEREVELEANRDLWRDVLAALLDRLEDGSPERQTRIVHLMEEILPSMLGSGAFDRAASLLDELSRLATAPAPPPDAVLRRIREVFAQLSRPETLQQLVEMMDEAPNTPQGASLERLLAFFPPEALAPLTRVIDTVVRPDVRRVVEAAAERLARDNREQVVRLLANEDPAVVRGALRWVARLAIGSATNDVIRLLRHEAPPVRAAAVEAAVGLRASVAAHGLLALLEDSDREVRLAAVRGLASLEYVAARPALEEAIQGKRFRGADRSEKIAFFEALGRVGGAEAVPFLDRLLNTRGWLGRGESAETRACAALGLARVRHPSARASLEAAANDADPVVRNAVTRSLRGEGA